MSLLQLAGKGDSPPAKGGQSPANVRKDTASSSSAPQQPVTGPTVQQNGGDPPTSPPTAAVPSSSAKEPSVNHSSLIVQPPPAEVPSPLPTLPSTLQPSPKEDVDALSSTSSSSSNSDKITAVGSQPSPFASTFNTSWVSTDLVDKPLLSISGLSTKSSGEGEEEGHFTAVTAQLPPPPLSDFYDRKFSSLDAFFSEYGRKVS